MTQEERQVLIDRRNKEFTSVDFAFPRCGSCGNDTVAEYGEQYPTAWITGCNKCGRSWCD